MRDRSQHTHTNMHIDKHSPRATTAKKSKEICIKGGAEQTGRNGNGEWRSLSLVAQLGLDVEMNMRLPCNQLIPGPRSAPPYATLTPSESLSFSFHLAG